MLKGRGNMPKVRIVPQRFKEGGFSQLRQEKMGAVGLEADEAAFGFMVWDGKSKGTILNGFRLIEQQKKAVAYNVAEKRFYEFKALAHWEEFISRCEKFKCFFRMELL